MSTIPFRNFSAAKEQIAEFLDSIPEVDEIPADALEEYREKIEDAIAQLDACEPKNEQSEAYELWGDMHEDLEDILDELLDRLEE